MNFGMQKINTSPSHKEGEFCIGQYSGCNKVFDSCMRIKSENPTPTLPKGEGGNVLFPPLWGGLGRGSLDQSPYFQCPSQNHGELEWGSLQEKQINRKVLVSLNSRIVKLALCLLFFLSSISFAYQTSDSVETQGQILPDSIEAQKSEPIDTIPPNRPLMSHGSCFTLTEKNIPKISKQDIQYINYANFQDILKRKMRQFPLFLGGYGEFNSFSIYGGNPRNISLAFNGRPIDDPAFSTLNLSQIAPEFMENAEILTGTDAITYSDNASSLFINLQEIIYDTKYPYTKIWLSKSSFDFISADGIFSQNFSKNWNFTFGFRTQTSAGRYDNSWLDSWNVRALLRWNPSERTSISLTEYFTNQGFGTTGGIENTGEDFCDDLIAFPIYERVNERVFRHDLTLSLTSVLDRDSSHAISGSVFLSNSDWDRRRSIDMLIGDNDSSLYYNNSSFFIGANARYENNLLDFTKLSIGGDLRYVSLESNDYIESLSGITAAAFSRLKINFTENFSLTGGLRLKIQHEKYAASLGGKINYNLSNDILLTADISYSERFPSPSEGLNLNNEKNMLGLFKFNWEKLDSRLSLTAFSRQVFSPLHAEPVYNSSGLLINTNSYNGDDITVVGATVEAATTMAEALLVHTDKIVASGWSNVQFSMGDDRAGKRFPVFYGGLELYYELIIGRSEARIGASIELLSAFKGERFFPIKRTYFPAEYEKGFSTNGTELFAAARLGSNAYVKISFENPLSQCYYYVPIHPMYEMNFKLSVSWSFMD
jgi:hypothetical protein